MKGLLTTATAVIYILIVQLVSVGHLNYPGIYIDLGVVSTIISTLILIITALIIKILTKTYLVNFAMIDFIFELGINLIQIFGVFHISKVINFNFRFVRIISHIVIVKFYFLNLNFISLLLSHPTFTVSVSGLTVIDYSDFVAIVKAVSELSWFSIDVAQTVAQNQIVNF